MDRPDPTSFRDDDTVPQSSSRVAKGDFKPDVMTDPPPKFRTAGYRVPPDRMLDGLLSGLVGAGMQVRLVDRDTRMVMAVDDMSSGHLASVTISVDESATGGSRVRLVYDRPPGTKMDPRSDDLRLGDLLTRTEEELPAIMGG